jgi:hypothetical protein
MMVMEAIRLSLAEEEDNKKKADKEAAKKAKKIAKEAKKKEKKERKGVYGSGASSVSGSALSLSLPGLGRRRGNSGGSNLAREITPESAEPTESKGKGVDRSSASSPPPSAPIEVPRTGSPNFHGIPGARHLDTTTLANIQESHQNSSPTAPDRPSHLRQMSNASSPASSFIESAPGSLRNDLHGHGSSSSLDTPNASGTNIASQTNGTPEGEDSSSNEPMFNFRSLAAMIGDDEEDKADAAKHIEHLNSGPAESSIDKGEGTTSLLEESVATLKVENSNPVKETAQEAAVGRQTTLLQPQPTTPEVMVTPVTPAALNHGDHDGKQLGAGWTEEHAAREITQ